MKVKFWGVRGSIPCPGPLTVKYGGNTACIELRLQDPNTYHCAVIHRQPQSLTPAPASGSWATR